MTRNLLLYILLLLSSGCTTLLALEPTPMFLAPIASPRLQIGAGTEPVTQYSYTDDASARPPDLLAPEAKMSQVVTLDGAYSLRPHWDVGVGLSSGSNLLPGGLGIWSRYVMQPFADTGWNLAVFAGAAGSTSSVGGNQKGIFGPGGFNWKASTTSSVMSIGTSIGYTIYPKTLAYFGFSYAHQIIKGSIEDALADDHTLPEVTYALDEVTGSTRMAGVGVSYGEDALLQLDARYLMRSAPKFGDSRAKGTGDRNDLGIGIKFVIRQ